MHDGMPSGLCRHLGHIGILELLGYWMHDSMLAAYADTLDISAISAISVTSAPLVTC
jgi:hypothetical protein